MSAATVQIEVLPRSVRVVLWCGLLALLAFPFVASDFYLAMVNRMMILAIFAMSLDVLQGVSGLVSLGHAAYFGVAGYALAFLTPAGEPVSLYTSLPLAVGAATLVALVIGFLVVRTHGIYFIMVTMAFAQMLYYVFFDNKSLGGSDGVFINFRPDALFFDLENKRNFYFFTLACLVAVYAYLRHVLWTPLGRALAGLRVNEHRMQALGYDTFVHKLAAFTFAGSLAGLAGYLWAAQTGFVNPELLGFHLSAHAIMMLILGGMGNFAGAILGAFSFEYLMHVFKDLPATDGFDFGKHWQMWMGLFIVLWVIFAPKGLIGLLQRLGQSPETQEKQEAQDD
ncbi:MAG: hypothetical protein RLZZ24_565 [Pseudomonadota bacterium]